MTILQRPNPYFVNATYEEPNNEQLKSFQEDREELKKLKLLKYAHDKLVNRNFTIKNQEEIIAESLFEILECKHTITNMSISFGVDSISSCISKCATCGYVLSGKDK